MGLYAFLALAFVGSAIGLSHVMGTSEGVERLIVIPAGTADRLAAGETVDILPADLRFEFRDRLVVVNDDDEAHTVGPFTVAPGDRLEKRFSEAATFDGFCSLHPSGNIRIEISGN